MKNISSTYEALNCLPGLRYLGDSFLPGDYGNRAYHMVWRPLHRTESFSHFRNLLRVVDDEIKEAICRRYVKL